MRLIEERRRSDLKELRLKQKEYQLRQEGVGSLRNLLGESRKTLENLVRELKEGELDKDKTRRVKEFLSALETEIGAESANLERESLVLASERRRLEDGVSETGDEQGFTEGMEVLAGESRRLGRIIRLDKKMEKKGTGQDISSWIVEIGSLKMSFSEKDLVPVSVKQGQDIAGRTSASWAVDLAPSSPLQTELRIRGMRFSDAMEALGRQLDSAVLGGLCQFAVIHGKGEGILRKGVHDVLKKDPRVADFFFSRPEAGGFGRTEVILKGMGLSRNTPPVWEYSPSDCLSIGVTFVIAATKAGGVSAPCTNLFYYREPADYGQGFHFAGRGVDDAYNAQDKRDEP
jgi:DNA mismatch repair protein MutS2